MSSTFYGLEIARKGLFISQKGLDVTGHNIANANTPGYTRQRLIATSLEPGKSSDGVFTYTAKGQVGGGVTIQELSQIRDKFLDMQYRRENTKLGEWSTKTQALQYIEDVFREPSDAGLNAVLANFFSDIQEMSKAPESKEIRTLVRQDAIKLTETLHHYYDQMVQLQSEQDTAIDITVNQINDIARNIRDLNEQIFRFEVGGENANDLRDKRNILIDDLSTLVKIDYYETPGGRFRVDIGGMALVDHTKFQTLETVKDDGTNPAGDDLDNLYSVKWAGSSIDVAIQGGKLKGYMDIRDGETADNMGIPYFIQQLNTFARAFVKEFNKIHKEGYTLPEGGNVSKPGADFFTHDKEAEEADSSLVTAKNITISKAILESVYNIAASGEEVATNDPNKPGNNIIALELAGLRDKKVEDLGGNFEDFNKGII
ncbi:MAG TPA: flagellar hook-associated protein FlgK, partial [Clostridia bacterium]|nr:flagellar hook-associated protein FlgK [Clostridia bacterium]